MTVERPSKAHGVVPISGPEIDALYPLALRLARRILPIRSDAEDAVQAAFAQLCYQLQMRGPITNIRAWLCRCVKNVSISLLRKQQICTRANDLCDEEAVETCLLSSSDMINCAAEYIKQYNIREDALKYLITKAVVLGSIGEHNDHFVDSISVVVSGHSHRHTSRIVSGSLREIEKIPGTARESLLSDNGNFTINATALFLALRDLEALASNQYMTDLMGAICSAFVNQVQQAAKICQIDLILRSGTDRHLLYESKLNNYVQYLDLLYTAAKLPRSCMILGALSYLHKMKRKTLNAKSLIDADYIEFFLSRLINDANTPFLDRWLAIITLGLHFERIQCDASHSYQVLTKIESIAVRNPVQRIGLAFAYLDASIDSKQLIIADKVLQLVRLDKEADLSLLPITIMGTFLGSDVGAASQGVKMKLLWDVTLRALASRSPVAVLGGLRHLYHIKSICSQLMTGMPLKEVSMELDKLKLRNSSLVVVRCLSELTANSFYYKR